MNRIIVVGGYGSSATMKTNADAWAIVSTTITSISSLTALSEGRFAMQVAVVGTRAFFIGGQTNTTTCAGSTKVDVYDGANFAYKASFDLPVAAPTSSVAVTGNLIYVLYAANPMGGCAGTCVITSPATNGFNILVIDARYLTVTQLSQTFQNTRTFPVGMTSYIGNKAIFVGGGTLDDYCTSASDSNSGTLLVTYFSCGDEVRLFFSPRSAHPFRFLTAVRIVMGEQTASPRASVPVAWSRTMPLVAAVRFSCLFPNTPPALLPPHVSSRPT